MTRSTLLTIFLIIFSKLLTAQVSGGSISGKVMDGGDQKIIDAASISLFKAKDSSLVKISLADKEGNFLFEHIPAGTYYLLLTSTGHLETYSRLMDIKNNARVDAGIIHLKTSIKTLNTVTITAEIKKPFIERKIDRTIINVDALITSAGSTAMDVLEKAPGVTVDKDGNISLKGKQGVMVMMDGRPTYLSADQLANLLKNMPSSEIDQVEIMTNPSAKYDAAGNSGIINIKTKKNKLKGMNGNVSASIIQGKYTRTNNSINLNYRNGKINLFANYNYSYWKGYQNLYLIRNFRDSLTKNIETVFNQQSHMHNSGQYQNLKLGLDYNASKKTVLGVVVSGYINPSSNPGMNTTLLENGNNVIDSIVTANNSNRGKSNNFSGNFNLRHSYDSTGKEYTLDLDYLTYYQNSDQLFINQFLNPDYTISRPEEILKGTLPAKINIYSAKTDFTFPLKKGAKIETGAKSSYVTTDNDALYQDYTNTGYVTDEGKTNHFIYKENINAAYVNYSRQIKKWGIQAGLRAENTNACGHQAGNAISPDSSFTKNYVNLFPTAYVSYQADKKNSLSLNYGRRIDRPAYEDLNPFYYFLDQYTYQVGNTLLQPQITDNIELSHTYKGFLTTTVNYSHTSNVFTDVIKQQTAERITFQTKENIASMTNYGLAVSAYFPVTKFLTTNLYTNAMHNAYQGALDGGYLNVNAFSFLANMSNQFKFKKGWSAELSGFYRSRAIESQLVMDPMWRLDAGLQKQVMKNKGTVKMSVRDIFASQKFSGYVKYQAIDINIKNSWDSRRVSLTFTYRFGKPLKNQQPRKTGSAEVEQSRVKSVNN